MNNPSLREFLERAGRGNYNQLAKDTWFDWFAAESTLPNKTKRLVPAVRNIAERYIPRNQWDSYIVFFKETIPMWTTGFNHTGWVQRRNNDRDVYWFSISKTTTHSGTSANYDASGDTLGIFGRGKKYTPRAQMSGLPTFARL